MSTDRKRYRINPYDETGAIGWVAVGIIIGVILVIWVIVNIFQAIL